MYCIDGSNAIFASCAPHSIAAYFTVAALLLGAAAAIMAPADVTLMDFVESELGQSMAMTCESDILEIFPLDDGGVESFRELLECDGEVCGLVPVCFYDALVQISVRDTVGV